MTVKRLTKMDWIGTGMRFLRVQEALRDVAKGVSPPSIQRERLAELADEANLAAAQVRLSFEKALEARLIEFGAGREVIISSIIADYFNRGECAPDISRSIDSRPAQATTFASILRLAAMRDRIDPAEAESACKVLTDLSDYAQRTIAGISLRESDGD